MSSAPQRMTHLFPALFDHPTLWLSDMTLLRVFLASASDTVFLTLRSGIKYCRVCMVTSYWQATVGCDLNCSATVLLLYFVLRPLISNTTDNLLRLEDKGRSPFNVNWTFYVYHERCSSPPLLLTATLVVYLVCREKSLAYWSIKMCKLLFLFWICNLHCCYILEYTSLDFLQSVSGYVSKVQFRNQGQHSLMLFCPQATRQNSLGNWNNFYLNITLL